MDLFPWDITLTVLGVVVPVTAAFYEFALVGRKRLGYRVQMDTPAFDGEFSGYSAGLRKPSLVLIRIENNGSVNIDESDYAVAGDDPVGLRIRFPKRRVVHAYTSGVSDPGLRHSTRGLTDLNGAERRTDERDRELLKLPKVPLNRTQYYKALVLLDETEPDGDNSNRTEEKPDAVVEGDIKGGRIQLTKYRSGLPRAAVGIIASLVTIIVALYFVSDDEGVGAPLDCATGRLTIVGSTALKPMLKKAADTYRKTCPGAEIDIRNTGSKEGIRDLHTAGRKDTSGHPDMLAFSDGKKEDGYPQLLPRPVAFALFTLVINEEAEVQDLTREQIERIYAGEIRNWKQVGGADLPVRLVSRYSNSGTRRVLEDQVLRGVPEPNVTSRDCTSRVPRSTGRALRCERGSTGEVLDTVSQTPGALGYSEVRTASQYGGDLRLVRIDGRRADLAAADRGPYPYWETEYGYTYGEPQADSLAASFLRYLTNEVGQDIIRSHGQRPCAELQNPQLCHPA